MVINKPLDVHSNNTRYYKLQLSACFHGTSPFLSAKNLSIRLCFWFCSWSNVTIPWTALGFVFGLDICFHLLSIPPHSDAWAHEQSDAWGAESKEPCDLKEHPVPFYTFYDILLELYLWNKQTLLCRKLSNFTSWCLFNTQNTKHFLSALFWCINHNVLGLKRTCFVIIWLFWWAREGVSVWRSRSLIMIT